MKTYEPIEPNIQAAKITAVNTVYTLDDGSTMTVAAADQAEIGAYAIPAASQVVTAAVFEAKYKEVEPAAPLGPQ